MFYLLIALGYFLYVLRYVILFISFGFGAYGLFVLTSSDELKPLSFIPIARFYLLTDLVFRKPGWIGFVLPAELILSLLFRVAGFDFVIFQIFEVLIYLQEHLLFYFLYRLYRPKKALKYALLGALFSPLDNIWLFIIRKRRRKEQYALRF